MIIWSLNFYVQTSQISYDYTIILLYKIKDQFNVKCESDKTDHDLNTNDYKMNLLKRFIFLSYVDVSI